MYDDVSLGPQSEGINKQRKLTALNRHGTEQKRPESPTGTPPGMRVNTFRVHKLHQRYILKKVAPQWHTCHVRNTRLHRCVQAYETTATTTTINQWLFNIGLSPLISKLAQHINRHRHTLHILRLQNQNECYLLHLTETNIFRHQRPCDITYFKAYIRNPPVCRFDAVLYLR